MIELQQRHTGNYLAKTIIDHLRDNGIEPIQILAFTTDNGANVLKMIRDINEEFQNQTGVKITDSKKPAEKQKTSMRNLSTDFNSGNNEMTLKIY